MCHLLEYPFHRVRDPVSTGMDFRQQGKTEEFISMVPTLIEVQGSKRHNPEPSLFPAKTVKLGGNNTRTNIKNLETVLSSCELTEPTY